MADYVIEAPEERWLPVPGYEGYYEVSTRGQVYSIRRPATRGGILIPDHGGDGYWRVKLCRPGYAPRTFTVDALVRRAFGEHWRL